MTNIPSWVQVGIMVTNHGHEHGRGDRRRYPAEYAMRYLHTHRAGFEIPADTTLDEITAWFEQRLTRSGPVADELRERILETLADAYLSEHKLLIPGLGGLSERNVNPWPWPTS